MTVVINLFGGPGCGKSTLAAELFVAFKRQGKNVELVREYVKDWAWANRKIGIYDQLYICGKQSHKEVSLYGKVDVIITDSPLLLGPFYQEYYSGTESYVLPAVSGLLSQASRSGVKHLNFHLSREKKYNPAGRYETEEQAVTIDNAIATFLIRNGVKLEFVTAPDSEKCSTIQGVVGEWLK